MAACNNARLGDDGEPSGDATELAMLRAAQRLGAGIGGEAGEGASGSRRRAEFHFDPVLKLMSTVDEREGSLVVHTKGAPEAVLPLCARRARPTAERRRSATPSGATSKRWSTGSPVRGCGSWPSPAIARRRGAGAARGGRARPRPARPGGDDRSAAARGRRRGRQLPPGGDTDRRHHRGPPSDGGRDRQRIGISARRARRGHRARSWIGWVSPSWTPCCARGTS